MKVAILLFAALTASTLQADAGRCSFKTPRESSTPAPKASPGREIKAVISGIRDGAKYGRLPQAQVWIEGLPTRTAVWVEAYPGPARPDGRGLNVPSRLVPRGGGKAVLTVNGLKKRCTASGTWTISVMVSDSRGTRMLARKTFSVGREG